MKTYRCSCHHASRYHRRAIDGRGKCIAEFARDVSENITEVSNSAIKTGQIASTVLTAAAELADQSHLLRRGVERYLAQLRVAS